ncbi:chromatin associated protein [Pluteus cervinus]|uniref:Chromatin associated protein n=1 Tax=Pluteus cervinus TaxID=181527 RepID=A0ACD3ASV1_9AGAR|nr:chromatin associated protein [Pluteus cervinus]
MASSSTGAGGADLAGSVPSDVPPEYRKEGADWFAEFNPSTKRVLDIQLVHSLDHASVVCCVQFSADGKYLATGGNRTAQIYDVKTGAKICILADESVGGDLYIRSVRFSPDGKYLATAADDHQIRVWDIATKLIRVVFDGHEQEVYSLAFSHDGQLIVSGSADKTVRIWNVNTGFSRVLTIDATVTSVAISPDGRYIAAGSLDKVVWVWEVATGVIVEKLRGHKDSVYSVAFTPDGKGLISGSLDKTLKYWDVGSLIDGAKKDVEAGSEKAATMDFVGHKDYVLSGAVSQDGRWVVSGSKDRNVQFWDAATATVQCTLQGHKNSVISVDLNNAGGLLATGSGDSHARIWSYTSL